MFLSAFLKKGSKANWIVEFNPFCGLNCWRHLRLVHYEFSL